MRQARAGAASRTRIELAGWERGPKRRWSRRPLARSGRDPRSHRSALRPGPAGEPAGLQRRPRVSSVTRRLWAISSCRCRLSAMSAATALALPAPGAAAPIAATLRPGPPTAPSPALLHRRARGRSRSPAQSRDPPQSPGPSCPPGSLSSCSPFQHLSPGPLLRQPAAGTVAGITRLAVGAGRCRSLTVGPQKSQDGPGVRPPGGTPLINAGDEPDRRHRTSPPAGSPN